MATGLVYLHRVPSALVQHVEWTIAGVCGSKVQISWNNSAEAGNDRCAVVAFNGEADAGSILAAAFMNLKTITFEVTQDAADGELGYRWSFIPSLGLYHMATDGAGNLVVSENQVRASLTRGADNPLRIQAEFRKLLGQAWDDELESYRERALVIGAERYNGVMATETERIAYRQNVRPL